MLPLCTKVTDLRFSRSAYSIADFAKREVPSFEIGLIPIPEVSGNRILVTPISFCKNSMTFFTSGVPAAHSIPA
jgi:hypothetical protein